MGAWHERFCDAARKRGFQEECIKAIWEKLLCFSLYPSFLKAHAVARALLLYRVAYIKARRGGLCRQECNMGNYEPDDDYR